MTAPLTSCAIYLPIQMPMKRMVMPLGFPHEERKQKRVLAIELVILGNVLFPKNLMGIWDFYNSGIKRTGTYIRPSAVGRYYKSPIHREDKIVNTLRMMCLLLTSLVLRAPCSLQTPHNERIPLRRFDPNPPQKDVMEPLQKTKKIGTYIWRT